MSAEVSSALNDELEAAVSAFVEDHKESTSDEPVAASNTEQADDDGAADGSGEGGGVPKSDSDNDNAVGESEGSASAGGEGSGESTPVTSSAVSDPLLTEAAQCGIPIEVARGFGTDGNLKQAIEAIRSAVSKFVPADEKKEDKPEEDILAKVPTLDPEQFEPEVIAVIDALRDAVKQQQDQLKELRGSTEYARQSAEQSVRDAGVREIAEWVDGQFAKLGEDFEDVVGVGGTEALSPASEARQKREAIMDQAAVLMAGYKAVGKTPPHRDEIFSQAAKIVLADQYAKQRETKIVKGLEKQQGGMLNRGSAGKSKGKTDPIAFAVAELEAKFFKKD